MTKADDLESGLGRRPQRKTWREWEENPGGIMLKDACPLLFQELAKKLGEIGSCIMLIRAKITQTV